MVTGVQTCALPILGGAIMIVALGLFGVASDPAHDEEDSSAEGTGETAQKDAV